MTEQNTRLGIGLMVLTTCIFAIQDGISRHLAENHSVFMVVMIRKEPVADHHNHENAVVFGQMA